MSVYLTIDPYCEAQWRLLLARAEALTGYVLDEGTEDYLVQLLIRVATHPELLSGLLSLDRLTAQQPAGRSRLEYLQDIGDQCLLFAGLFPDQITERMVRLSYFASLGRTAYQQAHELSSATPYAQLATGFLSVVELLQAMHELGEEGSALTPLHAFELWDDTGSDRALRYIQALTSAIP
ncbi:MAG: hypothetical protein LBV36_07645, partial [Chromatiales bacterium]|nr:hypothetical protein [Chromatiales bacterium]